MEKRIIPLLFLIFFLGVGNIYCQGAAKGSQSIFDMGSVNFNDPVVQKKIYLLKDYYFCKAIRENNAMVCSGLTKGNDQAGADICASRVNYFKMRYRLASDALYGSAPVEEIARNCPPDPAKRANCLKSLNAIRSNNAASCPDNACKAIVAQSKENIREQEIKDLVVYLSAYKNADPRQCKGMADTHSGNNKAELACEYLVGSEGVCEDDAGYKEFRQWYLLRTEAK